MLKDSSLKFLKDLSKNNNKTWFETHRDNYDLLKSEFLEVVEDIIKGISDFDKAFSILEAKNCTFRINRDVRFSKDKKPYKNNIAAYFNKDGKKGIGSGYYLHIQPGASFAAAGIWMPEPAVLANIRQEIDYNLADWKKIIGNKNFRSAFPEGLERKNLLLRVPKGYDPSNPAIDYLRMKSFIVTSSLKDENLLDKGFAKQVVRIFRSAKPIVDFLNKAID